ncbi:MAG: Sugar-specific transcriptional regulator TrmB [Methanosaeta sp. PtaU1.Bin060]|nr:MAG: Sugar-specific transcriptional regulator TrmB [Methanosaeta sp. PtaU1.Bin060]
MHLSKNDIRALALIAGSEEPVNPRTLLAELGFRRETISRLLTHLEEQGLIERRGREVVLAGTLPAEAFKKLYYSHRASPLQKVLSLRRVELLARLDQTPKSLEALARETGIPSDTLYGYLKGFLRLGVVKRSREGRAYLYSFNYILWSELKDFVTVLMDYRALRLVPRDALLIKSYGDCVLFKSIRLQDATPTSFSAYEDYGIELGLRDNYYTLPKRDLSIQEVFIHSLDSAEDLRQRLFCILFYLKNKQKLESVDHPMMKDIKAVLQGERIKGYPSLEDIEDRAELYEIEL